MKVFKETNNLEFEAEPALLRQQHQEHLEQLRDRSAKAQQQLWRIQQYTSPDIQANIKSCPPRTKLPADDDYTPIPKPRRSIQKPGRIQLQLEALEDQLKKYGYGKAIVHVDLGEDGSETPFEVLGSC